MSTTFGIAKLARFEVITQEKTPRRLMKLPRITLSPTELGRKAPPRTAKWHKLTLAALMGSAARKTERRIALHTESHDQDDVMPSVWRHDLL